MRWHSIIGNWPILCCGKEGVNDMDTLAHIKSLSGIRSMNGIAQLTPAAFPGSHCPMHTALSLAVHISGVSTIVIGTPECSYYSRNIPLSAGHSDSAFHWTYILDSKEIVFGCRKGLTDAILEMDRAGAKAILLISTCIPELIGEDVESLCTELQPQINAPLICVALGNFKCGGYEPGNWKTLFAFRKLIRREGAPDGTVNVLGRSRDDDHSPLPLLLGHLQELGVSLRYLGPESELDDFIQAGQARLNLIVSPFFDQLGEWMERELHIPSVNLHRAYCADEIRASYVQVGQHLDLDLEPGFLEQYREICCLENQVARQAAGLHYVSATIGALQPLPLSLYLSSLGMSPILIHLEEFYPSDTRFKEMLLARGENPPVCLMLNPEADWEAIKSLQPDFVLGDRLYPDDAPPVVRISDLYMRMGFERTKLLLKRLCHVQKEGEANGTL